MSQSKALPTPMLPLWVMQYWPHPAHWKPWLLKSYQESTPRASRAALSSALSQRTAHNQTPCVFQRGTLKAWMWYPVIQVSVFPPYLTCVNHKVKGMEYSGRLRSSHMAHMAGVWNLESVLLVMETRVCKGAGGWESHSRMNYLSSAVLTLHIKPCN